MAGNSKAKLLKVLICGGRNMYDWYLVSHVMDAFHKDHPVGFVVTGGQTGADKLGSGWAKQAGIDRCEFPYNGSRGKAGGPFRNRLMLHFIKPDAVIAFPGGTGTANMTAQAEERGIWVPDLRPWYPPEDRPIRP